MAPSVVEPPSRPVFFSLRKQVVPASGQELRRGLLVAGEMYAGISLPKVGGGTTNWQTFTEQAVTLRIDLTTILAAIALTALIGTLGGIIPAWRASRLEPVEALRQV